MSSECYVCPILTKIGQYRIVSLKIRNMKSHLYYFGRSCVFPCGRTDRQADMTRVVVAISSANAHKKTVTCETQTFALGN
jgi:hypothetical protein